MADESTGSGVTADGSTRRLGGMTASLPVVVALNGYFGRMARPGRSEDRSEDTSVPIWLKLSAVDSAKMEQVLARPEFEGWTKGEWCLEIIQTALRYYTRPRPAGEPGRRRAPARPAADSAPPPPAEAVPPPAEAVPPPAEAMPLPADAPPASAEVPVRRPRTEAVPPRVEATRPLTEPKPPVELGSPPADTAPPARPTSARARSERTVTQRPQPAAGQVSPSRETKPATPGRSQGRRPEPEPETEPPQPVSQPQRTLRPRPEPEPLTQRPTQSRPAARSRREPEAEPLGRPGQRRPSRSRRPEPGPPEPGPPEPGPPEAGPPEAGPPEPLAAEGWPLVEPSGGEPEAPRGRLVPGPAEPEQEQAGADELDLVPEVDCAHPAEARDYQSGTCAACGAILWD